MDAAVTIGGHTAPVASPAAQRCVELWAQRRARLVASIDDLRLLLAAAEHTQQRLAVCAAETHASEVQLRGSKAILQAQARAPVAPPVRAPAPSQERCAVGGPARARAAPSPPATPDAPSPTPPLVTGTPPSPPPPPPPPPIAERCDSPQAPPFRPPSPPGPPPALPAPERQDSNDAQSDVMSLAGGVMERVASALGGKSAAVDNAAGRGLPWPDPARPLPFSAAASVATVTCGLLQLRSQPSIFRAWKRRVAFVVGGALLLYRDGAAQRDSFAEHYVLTEAAVTAAPTTFGEAHVLAVARVGDSASRSPPSTCLAFETAAEAAQWSRKLAKAARRAALVLANSVDYSSAGHSSI